jgi:hypothetical protein
VEEKARRREKYGAKIPAPVKMALEAISAALEAGREQVAEAERAQVGAQRKSAAEAARCGRS